MKKRLFSGIQPSGIVHIGNYLGAIRNWVRMLDEFDGIFSIVDYHAITVEYDPGEMPRRILDAAAANIACGLDPARCTIFVQSHVPEHTELAWIFGTVTAMGDLERMTQYKDKAEQHRLNVNAGLFTYPILQAADISLYKGEIVPVGEDQVQHIELAREIVRRFNRRFGPVFPEPQERLSPTPRILGLDGKAKMSKSLNNYIALEDTPDEIWRKLSTAVTDENRKRRTDPGNPAICNIFTLHQAFSSAADIERVAQGCRTAGIGCVECKRLLADNMVRELTPVREKILALRADPEQVKSILREGAERCRAIASGTMHEVRKSTGLSL